MLRRYPETTRFVAIRALSVILATLFTFGGSTFLRSNFGLDCGTAAAASGDLIELLSYPSSAPQGITRDGSDGTYWIPSLLDGVIHHFDQDLSPLGSIPSPFLVSQRPTGIAWYPLNDTLLVVESASGRLLEIDKTGQPVNGGIDLLLPISGVVNPGGPVVRGITVDPLGGSGIGSVYVVETVGAQIYEIDLFGFVIRSFDHPQDPDGFPGGGTGVDTGGIELIKDAQGVLVGIDLIGTDQGAPVILRLEPDGSPTGFEIPLISTGAGTGGVGGITRAVVTDPVTGDPIEAVIGTAESLQSIFIIDGSLPPIAQINDFECSDGGNTVALSWLPGPGYDAQILERNGDLIASLPGNANSYIDSSLPDGVYEYTIRGFVAALETDPEICSGVIGSGQVEDVVILDSVQFGLDITVGGGLLYITTNSGFIRRYTKELFLDGEIPIPFTGPDDDPAAIAYRPETDTLLVVNAFDNQLQEIDLTGVPVGPPVLLNIDVPDDDPTYLGAIAYDPNGNGGDGEIWATESTRSLVYRLSRQGDVLGVFTHPDELFAPTPDPSFINTYCLGISGVPEVGGGFDLLDLGGGTWRDRIMTRAVRVDAATGVPVGSIIPFAGMNAIQRVRYVGLVNSDYLGAPVTFAIGLRAGDTRLYRLDRSPPSVTAVDYLKCEQPDLVDRAELTFTNHGPYDSITLERDGVVIATLPGDASSFTDNAVIPGVHRYRVTPITGGISAPSQDCTVRVGIGALLRDDFLSPAFSPYQMSRSTSDGSYVVTSNSGSLSDVMFRFDSSLNFLGTIPAAESLPWLVAAVAIRPTAFGDEIWTIVWEVPAPPNQPQVFRLYSQDTAGNILSGPTTIDIPGAGIGIALTYPSAMVHDPESDTFWFLERNTNRFWQMGLNGQLLQSFDHPKPPLQQFVFNLGLTLDPERNVFTATTADAFETEITQAVEMSRSGALTGTVIPLTEAEVKPIYGMTRDGAELHVMGSQGSIPLLITLKAADPVAHPTELSCVESSANVVTLSWTSSTTYDEVVIRRGGVEVAVLPGSSFNYVDQGVGNGTRTYGVSGRTMQGESSQSVCSIVVAGQGPQFVRGDATDDGLVNLADPIYLLSYLFTQGPPAPCEDAADANDTGSLDLSDAIYLLNYLFTNGLPPEPPFPDEGADPTGDTLSC